MYVEKVPAQLLDDIVRYAYEAAKAQDLKEFSCTAGDDGTISALLPGRPKPLTITVHGIVHDGRLYYTALNDSGALLVTMIASQYSEFPRTVGQLLTSPGLVTGNAAAGLFTAAASGVTSEHVCAELATSLGVRVFESWHSAWRDAPLYESFIVAHSGGAWVGRRCKPYMQVAACLDPVALADYFKPPQS